MSNPLTLSPDTLADLIQQMAHERQMSAEALLEELAYRYLDSVPVEFLEDEQVLALSNIMMSQTQQDKLNDLLERQTEGSLDKAAQNDLDTLMEIHNRLLMRKSEAIAVAVQRGLRAPLGKS
jgi:hypothetical protein